MAVNLGSAFASVELDTSGVIRASEQASNAISSLGNQMQSVGKSVAGFGAGFTASVSLPLALVAKTVVTSASDLAETTSKIEQVFGDASGAIIEFAESADTALGQSKQSALDAAANFALFGKAAGLTGEELVDFSAKSTALASDLASFSNTSPEQAIEAIGAALRGESEPIRAYGVLLDDATLRQRALEMGIYDGTGALTAQQRVLAAQSEIFAQTATQQGDFARTSEGLANQQRILKAEFDNIVATIGKAFLPIALNLTEVLVRVLAKVGELVSWFSTLSPRTQEVVGYIGALAIAVGPLLIGIGGLVSVLGSALSALAPVVALLSSPMAIAIAGAVAGVALLASAFVDLKSIDVGGIVERVASVISKLPETFGRIVDDARLFASNLKNAFTEIGAKIAPVVAPAFKTLANGVELAIKKSADLKAAFGGFISGAQSLVTALAPIGNAIAGIVGAAAVAGFSGLISLIGTALPVAVDVATSILSGLGGALSNAAAWFAPIGAAIDGFMQKSVTGKEVVATVFDQLGIDIFGAIDTISGAFQSVGATIETALQSISTVITTIFGSAISTTKESVGALSGLFPALVDALSGLGGAFQSLSSSATPAILALQTAFSSAWATVAPILSAIAGGVSSLGTVIAGVVAGIVVVLGGVLVGAVNGVASAFATALPYVVSIVTSAVGVITGIVNTLASVISLVTALVTGDTQQIGIAWASLKESVSATLTELWNIVETLFVGIVDTGKVLISGFVDAVAAYFDLMAELIAGKADALIGAVSGILTSAKDAALGIASGFVEIGQQIINGIVSAISGGAGAIVSAIVGAVGAAIDAAKSALGINSPSRVMVDMFGYVVDGMVIGLENGTSAIVKTADKIASAVTSALTITAPAPSFAGGISGAGLAPLASITQKVERVATPLRPIADSEKAVLSRGEVVRFPDKGAQGGGETLTINLSVDGGSVVKTAVTEAVKEALKEAGVRTDLIKRMK